MIRVERSKATHATNLWIGNAWIGAYVVQRPRIERNRAREISCHVSLEERSINLVVQIFNGRNDSKPIVVDRYFEEQPSPRYILPVLILKSGCNGRDYNGSMRLSCGRGSSESPRFGRNISLAQFVDSRRRYATSTAHATFFRAETTAEASFQ